MKKVAIIGVPMDLGANRRGVDMGPSAIRGTGLYERIKKLGIDVEDRGNVDVPIPEELTVGSMNAKYADVIEEVCSRLYKAVLKSFQEGRNPILLGGDHSIAMGSVAAAASYHREKNQRIGLVWVDAHADMNTPESTPSGNVHGMPFAHILGMCDGKLSDIGGFRPKVSPENACLVGVRDIDDREKKLVKDSGINVFTMKEIDRFGISRVIEEAIKSASKNASAIHVSIDLDAIDPTVAPGVGTPKRGGLDYRESHLIMELVSDSELLSSLDIVELNPMFDTRNQTAELASELILSALGKSIF